MLAEFLKLITKAPSKTAVKSEANKARNAVRKNPKMTGAKEEKALERIDSAVEGAMSRIEGSKPSRKAPAQGVAGERAKVLSNEEAAKTTQKKGSIAKKMTVSAEDIKQANTARALGAMQRRVDELPDGNRKKMMQTMLDKQVKQFEKMQADEVDTASRKSAQSARDKKPFKGYTPTSPFAKGGMPKKKKAYNKGGYANCGASVAGTQGKK